MQTQAEAKIRRRLDVRGQVQGVGFRPYVYRLACDFNLAGFVANDDNGALIEVEGPARVIEAFERGLVARLPTLACIVEMSRQDLSFRGDTAFSIRHSESRTKKRPEVTPDAATCADCLVELFDRTDRRYRHPFINCTNCGPRYSIICTVPYDRPATTMADFAMCAPCEREYGDPRDRRFHAQPNACPVCGPQLQLCQPDRTPIDGDPITLAAGLLAGGKIVAVKGIGGYHLACRADQERVVAGLRERKLRDGKPLATMAPDLVAAHRLCKLAAADVDALASPAAPIVLVPKAEDHGLAPSIAPGCGNFGIMLPYAPVHHLLFAQGLGPLVMTSANLAGQPLTYEDDDAFEQLSDVADAFLTHNRRIFRPIDDSVVFTFHGETIPLRRARGYAPQPLRVEAVAAAADAPSISRCPKPKADKLKILALGGELKSTVCLYSNGEAILSEHLGDLTRPETYRHFLCALDRLKELFAFEPQLVAYDLHPRYLSTQYARGLGIPAVGVQHHHAHIASMMAEWGVAGPVIGLSCDGAGYGTDGAVWGCEVLHCQAGEFERLGHLEYFPLVGGDAAALETWRPAAALLRQALGQDWRKRLVELAQRSGCTVGSKELDVFEQQAAAGVNAPPTSSLGRVFDAVSFLLGLCARNRHEAEAAMALEAAAAAEPVEPYSYDVSQHDGNISISLLRAMVQIAAAAGAGRAADEISARFHETVARALADAAVIAREKTGTQTAALSGGCFANRRLLTRLVELLESQGVRVLYNRRVPCGDGGLSLGQAFVAAWKAARDESLRRNAAR